LRRSPASQLPNRPQHAHRRPAAHSQLQKRRVMRKYNPHMPESMSKPLWRAVVSFGAGLVVLGLCAIGLDFVTMDHFDLSRYFQYFFLAILVGLLFLIVGLIGWAKRLDRGRRISIGTITLIASVSVCLVGSLMGGTNVHGPFYLFFLTMLPVGVVGLIVLLMGVVARTR
jgi:hypothetical protein